MKHNKLFASLLTLTLSATMCMSLAACGETDDNDDKNDDNEVNTNAAYVVTKAEWEAAFDFTDKNCTVNSVLTTPGDSDYNGKLIAYLTDEQTVWTWTEGTHTGSGWGNYLKTTIDADLNEGYTFYASKAYSFFAYDETTHSYKSTGSWYTYLAELFGWSEEGEDPAQYVGEVKFQDKKLVYCAITLNAG
ncbi:MAG: hypothetical protein K2J30_01315, partial [Clostridia bacterium]|nr:hypothetical protein [Clostridia bacterium]